MVATAVPPRHFLHRRYAYPHPSHRYPPLLLLLVLLVLQQRHQQHRLLYWHLPQTLAPPPAAPCHYSVRWMPLPPAA